jgi:cytochrome c-type biogenesis protein CcmF
MIQERKGMLRVWNMVLVALAFELSIFGDFLTRSGVINSIHSFAKSSIGRLVPRLRGSRRRSSRWC